MSRIGKLPIPLPAKVKADVKAGTVHVEGPKGKLQFDLPKSIQARLEDGRILVTREADTAEVKALHGLARAIVNNMVHGVGEGYVKRLEIHGVGFKAAVQGQEVTMNLGYSHQINYLVPAGVSVKVEENTKLVVEGPDKQAVGQVAAELRSYYPPEPYKGKGVRYSDERVVRKEGKKVQ
ncbi:MAG: 50S ribosomal protein L6 [Verrucomicrobiales bacterium]|nr:50S ribosomal protein L6 [Verrucomicrobiales bacterium]